jgi:hypothetical protein
MEYLEWQWKCSVWPLFVNYSDDWVISSSSFHTRGNAEDMQLGNDVNVGLDRP